MTIEYGNGTTHYGPGVEINLTGDEVALAIMAYLTAHGTHVTGPRTVRVNGLLCKHGSIYVDPSGCVATTEDYFSGRGPHVPGLRTPRKRK